MTHTQAIVTLISGLIVIITVVVGGFISLIRRWWELEKYIKSSVESDKKFKKADQKLKRKLRKLIENKYADHILFDERLSRLEGIVDDALQGSTGRRGLPSR